MGDEIDGLDDLNIYQKSSDVLVIEDYFSRYFILDGITAVAHFGWTSHLLNELDVRSIIRVKFSPVSSNEAVVEVDPYSSNTDSLSGDGSIHEQLSAAAKSDDFDVNVLIGIVAESEEDLEKATEKLKSKANDVGVPISVLQHQLEKAFKTIITGSDEFESPMRMSAEGVAASVVALSPSRLDGYSEQDDIEEEDSKSNSNT